ncbi:tetratricopeptide repeat protein [Nocardia sp. NPDC050793]|uniref:CHAT domain-containing tetratricopeptide repeat protein n=1 Tax=Nocardia sp. NPDC050793 TaxID=3155159 RepID=UPI0033DCA031
MVAEESAHQRNTRIDTLRAEIRDRLQKAGSGDWEAVLHPKALGRARELATLIDDDGGADIGSRWLLGWLHWHRHILLPRGRDELDLHTVVEMMTGCFLAGVGPLPEPLLPVLADRADIAAVAFLHDALSQADPRLITAAVELSRRILGATPNDHPDLAARMSKLGIALWARFEHLGAREDLDEAVQVGREAMAATPTNHPNRATILSSLGNALETRFECVGAREDLDEAVQVGREAMAATPTNHPNRAAILCNLGNALRARFECVGAREDLDEAVQVGREAVAAIGADHPDRPAVLTSFGNTLQACFERAGVLEDVDEAVQVGREAVAATPTDHPDVRGRLSNLGIALRARFERVGAREDLDEAVQVGREAVAATPADHPDLAGCLSTLGSVLLTRFESGGAREDLEEAVQTLRGAVAAVPADHPAQARRLSNLGAALWTRFERVGVREDLDEAVQVLRGAVAATPTDDPRRATILSNLGIALRARFGRAGEREDLDEAVHVLRGAVAATPTDHPDLARRLSNWGAALQARFERASAREDLDEAVQVLRGAVAATPTDHPDLVWRLSNLGTALWTRFGRAGEREDLDEAVQVLRGTVAATPTDHPNLAWCLSNLGAALQARFGCAGEREDLEEAVQTLRGAVVATPTDHPNLARMQSNLSNVLRARFEREGEREDLEEAVQLGREAVTASPTDHPDLAGYLRNLGNALRIQFDREGVREDLDQAVEALTQAANLPGASASDRILAGYGAGLLIASREPARAATLLTAAVLLLPQVAPRQLHRADKQYALGGFAGLAADAAALTLSDPTAPADQRASTALRLLESGRAVMLSQALHVRGDLTQLARRHPDLADRFIRLRDQLDHTPDIVVPATLTSPTVGAPPTAERTALDRHQLAREFDDLLTRIRGVEGFPTFGLPPSREQLVAQAMHGPVVVLNVSRYRSDALLVTPTGVENMPLPDLALGTLVDHVISFHAALSAVSSPASTFSQRRKAQGQLVQVLEWLWDTAVGPVLNALGYTESPAPGMQSPRVWWIPGGVLGLLPVHAAGYHSQSAGRTALDRVVSSYTPTITALRHARRSLPADLSATPRRALIVAMPTTPNLPDHNLDYASAEARTVANHLPGALTLTGPDPGDYLIDASVPTTAAVLEVLPTHAIVHFACHGFSDPTDPSRSRLLLHDHSSNPLTVAALATLHLDHAQLAYLSACETALTANTKLVDEAIHLTSAFQLAGYPHVIGTLWAINDHIASDIADIFYSTLTLTTTDPHAAFDTNCAARALHDTIRTVRDQHPTKPSLWAAYLHAGA